MPQKKLSSRHRKLLDRLATIPSDFEWGEMEALLGALSFIQNAKKGSGVRFRHRDEPSRMIHLHKPHNRNPPTILKPYLREVVASLKEWGLYNE